MRNLYLFVMAAGYVLLSVGTVIGADYYVDARTGADGNSGASPLTAWKTITHALASVSGTAGDPATIYIAAGTYSPSENDESFPLQMKSYVSLIGEGADTVILDAEDTAYHVIYCAEVDHLTIEDLTFMGGSANGSGTDGKGGGALFAACSDVIVQYCTISENRAWMGGGIHCDVRAAIWLEGCLVSDNSSFPDSYGYSYGGGVGILKSSPTLIHCTIEGNSAVIGAGVVCDNSSSRIAWCLILDNWCIPDPSGGSSGGGIRLSEASPLIEDCTFSLNFAIRGGAIQTAYSYFDIRRCKFKSNEALSGAGIHIWGGGGDIVSSEFVNNFADWGGGISANDCLPTVKNSLFALNVASYLGGGMYVDNEALPFISNCTFDSNSAGESGGAVVCVNDSAATLENSILWANGSEIALGSGGSASVSNCCVYGGYPGDNNISDGPLFATGPNGDYYLSCVAAGQDEDSPCIDAGNDTAANCELDCLTTRTDGVPDSWMVDLGYHYPSDATGELAIYCYLNDENFAPGDTLIAHVEVDNAGPEAAVDVYVAIVLPDGAIMCFTGGSFVMGLYPWFSDITLVEGFMSGALTAFETPVPGGMDGDYLFAAALTEPGTLTYSAGPCIYAFSIQAPWLRAIAGPLPTIGWDAAQAPVRDGEHCACCDRMSSTSRWRNVTGQGWLNRNGHSVEATWAEMLGEVLGCQVDHADPNHLVAEYLERQLEHISRRRGGEQFVARPGYSSTLVACPQPTTLQETIALISIVFESRKHCLDYCMNDSNCPNATTAQRCASYCDCMMKWCLYGAYCVGWDPENAVWRHGGDPSSDEFIRGLGRALGEFCVASSVSEETSISWYNQDSEWVTLDSGQACDDAEMSWEWDVWTDENSCYEAWLLEDKVTGELGKLCWYDGCNEYEWLTAVQPAKWHWIRDSRTACWLWAPADEECPDRRRLHYGRYTNSGQNWWASNTYLRAYYDAYPELQYSSDFPMDMVGPGKLFDPGLRPLWGSFLFEYDVMLKMYGYDYENLARDLSKLFTYCGSTSDAHETW